MQQVFFQNRLSALQYKTTSPVLRDWMQFSGSFMQRLKEHGIANPTIQVVQHHWQLPNREERNELNLSFRTSALVREVLISDTSTIWMYARTIFPRNTLTGRHKQLAHLKNRSLGSVLFKDPTLQRSPFEIAVIQPGMKLHAKIAKAVDRAMPELWSRRSLFNVRGKSVLLTEVFMPEIADLR